MYIQFPEKNISGTFFWELVKKRYMLVCVLFSGSAEFGKEMLLNFFTQLC